MTLLKKIIGKYPLGFGGAAISGEGKGYGFGEIEESHAIGLLKEAYELGFRLFDTAPIYGFGLSEQRIGKAFKQNREDVFITSKSGITWDKNKRVDLNNDPAICQKMIEQSLRDLDTDYIDLFMVHWPDERHDIRRAVEVIAKAKDEGKIKHIGLCNTHVEDLKLAGEVTRIEAAQCQLNLFENSVVNDLFPYLKEHNISFMCWGPFEKGIITGTVDRNRKFDSSDARSHAPWWKMMDKEFRFDKMDKIFPLLKEHGHSGVELGLGYNLSHPEVCSVLCGARNSEQLQSTVKALENLPKQDLLDEVIEIVAAK